MSENNYRTDIIRPISNYDDLAKALYCTVKTYQLIESKIAPLIAKQINAGAMFAFVTKEWIRENVSSNNGMHPIMYNRMLDSIELFYSKHKGMRRLPSPHIVSHRSVHYGEGMFSFEQIDVEKYLKMTPNKDRKYTVNTVYKVYVDGLEPFYIENLRGSGFKYMLFRPKLGKTGMPNMTSWEALFFKTNPGYMIDHIDTDKNPRYNGTL